MHAVLWVEQFWNVHLQKLDREIFEDDPYAKTGSLENFQLYGNSSKEYVKLSVRFFIWLGSRSKIQAGESADNIVSMHTDSELIKSGCDNRSAQESQLVVWTRLSIDDLC